jgi:hypothetical protein
MPTIYTTGGVTLGLLDWGIFGWSKHDSNNACSGSWELLIVYGPLKFFHEEMVQLQRRKKKMGCFPSIEKGDIVDVSSIFDFQLFNLL